MWNNQEQIRFRLMPLQPSDSSDSELYHPGSVMCQQLPSLPVDDFIDPKVHDGNIVLEVECGDNHGWLYPSQLCQGSKGPCILFQNMWLTPNEFQYISGREAAKDWKRSIRHRGRSIKLLISKGFLVIHPSTCNCNGCCIASPVNRERLADKRTVQQESHNGLLGTASAPPVTGDKVGDQADLQEQNTDCIAEIKALIQRKKEQRRQQDKNMDFVRKQNRDSSPEPKKESRLTSIIDQLLSNKTKDSQPDICKNGKDKTFTGDFNSRQSPSHNNDKSEELSGSDVPARARSVLRGPPPPGEGQATRSSPGGRDGLVTASFPEGGAARGQQPTPGARAALLPTSQLAEMPTDTLATSSSVESSGVGLPIKSERLSPEPESSSPSVSPHSPSPARAFPSLLVPGFGLGLGLRAPGVPAASTAPFSPPPSLERFSPANLACGTPAIKQMEMMTRNYSDFMRSLAAKYNNQNTQDSFPMGQTNGLVRGFEGSFPFKGSPSFMVRNMDMDSGGGGGGGAVSGGGGGGTGGARKLDSQNSPTTGDGRNSSNAVTVGGGSCTLPDFSSSQTLLNLVRTASAQSASQLENYLKGAVKRSADGENRLDPLDLSVTHSKRPRTDGAGGRDLRDFRDLLQAEAEAAVATGDCAANLRTTTGKPMWMALLDRRMHRTDTSPTSRTSPKTADRQRCLSLCTEKSCSSQSDASEIAHWTVEDVVKFVTSVESCGEYADKFREQSIDGITLPLLTEEHLTLYMGLKLGPALKLRSTLARKIGHCAVCMHCIHCHGEEVDRRNEPSRSPSVSK